MLAKRIIAVLTFDNGVLTRTKNFVQDYKYTKNFVNNSLFDGIVLIDVSNDKKNRKNFYNVVIIVNLLLIYILYVIFHE